MTEAVAELAALAQRLLKAGDKVPDILRQLGEECVDLIKAGHDAGEDPYGETWDPKADGSDCHLVDSSNLRGGWHIAGLGSREVTVAPTAWYAKVHQGGKLIRAKTSKGLRFQVGGRWVRKPWVRLPPRPMVPDNRGLPPEWQTALTEVADKALEVIIGK